MQASRRPVGLLAAVGGVCLLLAGCMEPQTNASRRPGPVSTQGHRSQTLPATDAQTVFAAAEGVVMDLLEIASADAKTGVITFAPTEYARIGGARMRRTGQLAVLQVGPDVQVSVQVRTERYATPDLRVMSDQFAADDRPGVTPIQEDAGLTPAQQEYWHSEGRDSKMEAQILQRIVEVIRQSAEVQP